MEPMRVAERTHHPANRCSSAFIGVHRCSILSPYSSALSVFYAVRFLSRKSRKTLFLRTLADNQFQFSLYSSWWINGIEHPLLVA